MSLIREIVEAVATTFALGKDFLFDLFQSNNQDHYMKYKLFQYQYCLTLQVGQFYLRPFENCVSTKSPLPFFDNCCSRAKHGIRIHY